MTTHGTWLSALVVLVFLGLGTIVAHNPSDAFVQLRLDTTTSPAITGRIEVALRDLNHVIGLDKDDDGQLTWGEVVAARADVEAYVLSNIQLDNQGKTCDWKVTDYQINNLSDGAYSSLAVSADCGGLSDSLSLNYRLLFDVDSTHRGLLNFTSTNDSQQAETQTLVFSPETTTQSVALGEGSNNSGFIEFIRQGVIHIWEGIDHILFLLALLLPSVLERRGNSWVAVGNLGSAVMSVLKIVTAFTIAHSITLTLASLQIVSLPARLIESIIAASVVLAALNNIAPLVVERHRWLVALGFGLVHGFGFANVLADLGLPANALAVSLLGFNIGVELGQLAIVFVFLPVAFALRNTAFYQRFTVSVGSAAVILIAATWMAERILDFKVLPI
jgi:hypothetical protein